MADAPVPMEQDAGEPAPQPITDTTEQAAPPAPPAPPSSAPEDSVPGAGSAPAPQQPAAPAQQPRMPPADQASMMDRMATADTGVAMSQQAGMSQLPGMGGAPAGGGGGGVPYRQLKVEDALAYLDQVKMKFEKQPHIYNQFLDIMKEFKAQSIDTPGVIDRVLQLFHGHRELILGFNTFLPPGYKIEFIDDENRPRVQLKYPQGFTGPQTQPQGFAAAHFQQMGMGGGMSHPGGAMGSGGCGYGAGGPQGFAGEANAPQCSAAAQQSNAQAKKAPIEFDQAISYVTKIKTRFAKQPETYKAFLEILHTYQKEQKTIKEVYEQVSTLFKHHTDLLGEFSQFLPDGSPENQGMANTLKGKGKMAAGGLVGGKQHLAARPAKGGAAGAYARQQADDEEERFWQKRKGARGGKGADSALNRSPEAEFFGKCRNRMPKPLYVELLKCLNLYSTEILDRSELLLLVHDLFKRSQLDLFASFRRLLGYSGGDAAREAPPSPQASRAPIAEGGSFRDLDFSAMKKHGTSYRILPENYNQPSCSGRGPLEQLVLNDAWVSVPTGTEDLNFKALRKNQYEESIFRAEDERFELDTAIETNNATLHFLQPIAAEIAQLSEVEKRRYRLQQNLSAMHCKSIRRLYGQQGAQVLELLHKCPAAAVAAVTKRLSQKNEEWRELRQQLTKGWKEVYEKNYTKSLDHRSFYFKQGDKKNFSGKQMVMELKALADRAEPADADEKGEEKPAAAAAASSSSSDGCLRLPFRLKTSLQRMHDDTLSLMIFAAKLSFTVLVEEVDEKVTCFWDAFVRNIFACADLEEADGAAPMETGDEPGGCKPLVVACPDATEDAASREARPAEHRFCIPLGYPKLSAQLFVGNSHFYIFARLYHVLVERLAAAKEMALAKQALAQSEGVAAGDAEVPAATEAHENGVGGTSGAAALAASSEQAARTQLLETLRKEANGDLYVAFQAALRQLVEGKMEASVYEDVLRTLLGSNAYSLFTLHKIISQMLKQLQIILVEAASQPLLDLYAYERAHTALGAMSESTYRNNARLLLEGDDCFQITQLYAAGADGGGELVMAFLPEKAAEAVDSDDDEVDDEEEEEERALAGKGEWVSYMDSYVQLASRKASSSALVLSRALRRTRSRSWARGILLNGLECRASIGTCKLRFVNRSEDVWYANKRKRAAAVQQKRQLLDRWVQQRARGADDNALHGLHSRPAVALPNAQTWQPEPKADA